MRGDGQTRSEHLPLALAAALEHAARAVARLGSALAGHPLAPAWAWRARLDAVRRQAAADGRAIDPWHLAAVIEGVRLRVEHVPPMLERGLLFAAAGHAFGLYRWFSRPDEPQQAAIAAAAAHLDAVAGDDHAPLLGGALGVHAWLDQGGELPPLRAALAAYWARRRVTPLPCPLPRCHFDVFTNAKAQPNCETAEEAGIAETRADRGRQTCPSDDHPLR
jgi:hypothetical protein